MQVRARQDSLDDPSTGLQFGGVAVTRAPDVTAGSSGGLHDRIVFGDMPAGSCRVFEELSTLRREKLEQG